MVGVTAWRSTVPVTRDDECPATSASSSKSTPASDNQACLSVFSELVPNRWRTRLQELSKRTELGLECGRNDVIGKHYGNQLLRRIGRLGAICVDRKMAFMMLSSAFSAHVIASSVFRDEGG